MVMVMVMVMVWWRWCGGNGGNGGENGFEVSCVQVQQCNSPAADGTQSTWCRRRRRNATDHSVRFGGALMFTAPAVGSNPDKNAFCTHEYRGTSSTSLSSSSSHVANVIRYKGLPSTMRQYERTEEVLYIGHRHRRRFTAARVLRKASTRCSMSVLQVL